MKKLSQINEGWGSLVRRDLTCEVRKENDPRIKINAFMDRKGITRYTINGDNTVDVDDNVIIEEDDLIDGKLPFKFGKVSGYFNCYNNHLTSLEGVPEEVGDNFYCFNNKLTSLEGGPEKVGGNFDCSNNKLTSLEGGPKEVGGDFDCSYNQLTSLEGVPEKVGGFFDCSYNQLTSLEGVPEKVGGNFYCYANPTKFTRDDIRNICNVGRRIEI